MLFSRNNCRCHMTGPMDIVTPQECSSHGASDFINISLQIHIRFLWYGRVASRVGLPLARVIPSCFRHASTTGAV